MTLALRTLGALCPPVGGRDTRLVGRLHRRGNLEPSARPKSGQCHGAAALHSPEGAAPSNIRICSLVMCLRARTGSSSMLRVFGADVLQGGREAFSDSALASQSRYTRMRREPEWSRFCRQAID